MGLVLSIRRKRLGVPPPRISRGEAIELASEARRTKEDADGMVWPDHIFRPVVTEYLDHYVIGFRLIMPTTITGGDVYTVDNQTGSVTVEFVTLEEAKEREKQKQLLRPAVSPAGEELLRPTTSQQNSDDLLLRADVSDPEAAEGSN